MKELLVFGIIALFIGLVFIPSFNAVSISMLENHPPDKPTILGPKSGYVGVEYNFTFNSTDPDGDNITYIVDWCDGTFDEYGPYYSGTEISANHTWYSEDMFTILVNARDIHDLEGGHSIWWIGISKSKDINQIQETTDDCDCQSNGKTYLAEKLLNRLKKNEVLSNVINLDKLPFERPVCILLNRTFQRIFDLTQYLGYLRDNLPEGSIRRNIIDLYLFILCMYIGPYILTLLVILNCVENPFQ